MRLNDALEVGHVGERCSRNAESPLRRRSRRSAAQHADACSNRRRRCATRCRSTRPTSFGRRVLPHHTSEAIAYREGAFRVPAAMMAATTYEVLGSLMFDDAVGVATGAAVLERSPNDEVHEGRADEEAQAPEPQLLVVVDHALLGAMEAELFDARPGGPCSELEAEVGERGVAQWAVDDRPGDDGARPGGAGFAAFPNWPLAAPTTSSGRACSRCRPAAARPGECRAPRRAAGASERRLDGGPHRHAGRAARALGPVGRAGERAHRLPGARGAGAARRSGRRLHERGRALLAEETRLSARLLAPLARLVLFRLRDGTPAYYGLDDAAAPAPHNGGAVLQQANTKLAFTDEDVASHARASECRKPATVVENERELKLVAWRTGRVCRADVVGRPTDLEDAMACVADALFSASDAAIVIETLRESRAARTASRLDAAPRPRCATVSTRSAACRVRPAPLQRRGGRSGGAYRRRRRRAAAALRARGRRHRASCACSWVTHVLYDGRWSCCTTCRRESPPVRRVGGGAPGARGGAQGGRAGSAARAGAGARAHAGGRHRARGGAGRGPT